MNFEHTVWLYITPAIVLIAASMVTFGLRRRETLLGKFAATRLLGQLTEKASHTRTLLKALCLLIGLAALGIALARPQYGVEWSERKARGLDIVFVLDSSKSMLATDMRPTRLDRAKLAVIDLTERLDSDRIGLVAFAGRAFLQTPPTLDYSAFRESLDSIGPETMTSGGSDLGNALKEAEKAFPEDNNFKVIVLLTDGEDLGGTAIETAKAAAENGIKVYAIGIGTPEGEYLRIRNAEGKEEFIRDAQGQPVRSQLDEATLQQIAQVTGGTYSRLSSESLNSLYNSVIATLPREEREAELQERPIERFQWVLAAAIIFLVLEILIRRRGNVSINAAILLAVFYISSAPSPLNAQSEVFEPLRNETDWEAARERPSTAWLALHGDPAKKIYNQAHEHLLAGEWEEAKRLYEEVIQITEDKQLERDALYNLAHVTYQLALQDYKNLSLEDSIEKFKKAEELFQNTMDIDPSDVTAKDDKELTVKVRKTVEDLKKQQQEQQQEQNQENQENSEENQDDSEQDQQQSDDSQSSEEQNQDQQESEDGEDQQNQDQQNQDQQNQDQQNGDNSEQGEQQDSQQGENSENQESSDQQSSEQGSEGEPTEDEQNQSGASEEESTEDPVDDIPQPQPGEEESEETGEQGEAPQPTEGEPGEEESSGAQAGGQAMQIEGMSQEDATALLESLRNGEKLLPFIDQNAPRNRGEVRDW